MNIELLKNNLPAFAKDIRLNLGTILSDEGAFDLNLARRYGIALACAYATKNNSVITAVSNEASEFLSSNEIEAAKAAATIMAMNNIYYRFVHLVSDKTFSTMPAGLRMNVIGNPGIDKTDFELYCLAVSAINGCGLCIDSHTRELVKAGVSNQAIQSTIKIASVINATAMALEINQERMQR